ncbi:MAG TPA: IclR family transcriptional regulator [Candidatus Limnocylindrales bacterium]|nr:IclR family transcriptional regulator [Candidatus Limnocylindrales bacterium]
MPRGQDASRVQSIERAFSVISALADGPLGVTDVADRASLPKSTAARLLASLAREGAVEQLAGETRYRIGPRLATLAGGSGRARGLIGTARPYLVELATQSGEAAGLSVPDGRSVHYIDQADSPNPVQVRDWTGTRIPMHVVSSGLVVLANLAPEALAAFLAQPLERFTEHSVVDPEALPARLDAVRRDGYAWVHEEFALGISSVAAPIADASGEVVAAVHLHGPSYRFPAPGTEARIGEEVAAAASRIGSRLRA